MPITITCPHCQARLTAPDAAAGKRIKCAKCEAVVDVPAVARAARPATPVRRASLTPDDEPPQPRSRKARPADDDVDDQEDDDDRPRRKRPSRTKKSGSFLGHPVVMVVGGLLGVGVAAGVLYMLWSSRQKEQEAENANAAMRQQQAEPERLPATRPQSKAGPAPAAAAPGAWRPFTLPDRPLSVSLPADPSPVAVPGGNRQPGVTVGVYQVTHNDLLYQVSFVAPDQMPPQGTSIDQLLDQLSGGLVASAGLGKETSRTPIQVAGRPGRQLVFANGAKNAVIRMTYANGCAYILVVASQRTIAPTDPAVAQFLDSVKFGG